MLNIDDQQRRTLVWAGLAVVMTAFDVVAGYTISIVAAEHDLGVGRPGKD